MRHVAPEQLFPQHATNDGFWERFEQDARIVAPAHPESKWRW